uniref:hypothetical protein n=1 Tax=Acetatifactor sp. TaxID=1872090 RepID=UPI0040579D94
MRKGICHRAGEAGIDEKLGKKLVTVERARGKVILATALQMVMLVLYVGMVLLIVWKKDGFCENVSYLKKVSEQYTKAYMKRA